MNYDDWLEWDPRSDLEDALEKARQLEEDKDFIVECQLMEYEERN